MHISLSINELKNSRILFISGAGLSTGSGLPTYYGEDGVYTKLQRKPEDILNQYNLDHHPEIIWNVIKPLYIKGFAAEPSLSHKKIAQIQSLCKDSMIFTQNVDDLHEKAGSFNIQKIHGDALVSICQNCKKFNYDYKLNTIDLINTFDKNKCPRCPNCGYKKVRPDIVPFGGMIKENAYKNVMDFIAEDKVDYIFIIGTQLIFYYITDLISFIKSHNSSVSIFDINPDQDYHNNLANFNVKQKSDEFFNSLIIE